MLCVIGGKAAVTSGLRRVKRQESEDRSLMTVLWVLRVSVRKSAPTPRLRYEARCAINPL